MLKNAIRIGFAASLSWCFLQESAVAAAIWLQCSFLGKRADGGADHPKHIFMLDSERSSVLEYDELEKTLKPADKVQMGPNAITFDIGGIETFHIDRTTGNASYTMSYIGMTWDGDGSCARTQQPPLAQNKF